MREKTQGYLSNHRETKWMPFVKSFSKRPAIFLFWAVLFVGAFVSTRLLNSTIIANVTLSKVSEKPQPIKVEFPLNCSAYGHRRTCPSSYPTTISKGTQDLSRPSPSTCPEYFRWIHEDLRPWAHNGITRETLELAKRTANFRLVILNGKAYVERYNRAFQTRDVFTLWGILQLLRWYPGKVPDLELIFDCVDWPVVFTRAHTGGINATSPPPLFRYCGDDDTLDIVFPDWSFWGWPEINIKPWVPLLKDLSEGNKMTKWEERQPYAYWKGNPIVAATRQDLLKCNVSDKQDWNARVYSQDWIKESNEGYNKSNLANQCVHKYKIYIEGSAWSVSEKYILACDSPTLVVKPHYYDFFTRSLEPMKHYWPIKDNDKCRSIKFAVDWGNNHKEEAQAMGKAASEFIREDLKMDYVYDYMFHLLNEYAKLLKFKPKKPRRAIEFCSEFMACLAKGVKKDFMIQSMVTSPSENEPCTLPPPYSPSSLFSVLQKNTDSIEQVEMWQNKFWEDQTDKET